MAPYAPYGREPKLGGAPPAYAGVHADADRDQSPGGDKERISAAVDR